MIRPLILAAFICISLVGSAWAEPTATLRRCYDWALARSEALQIRAEDIAQSRERARAALGGVFPKVNWLFTETWQDPDGVDRLARQGFSGFISKEQPDSRFSVRQPLFSGLKEFSALYGFQKQAARDELLLQRASRELFETVVLAFYDILNLESQAENARSSLRLAVDRVKDLKGYLRLGKARDSEVFTAEARAAALKASLRHIEGGTASAREELSFLTGQDLSKLPLEDELGDRPAVGTLEEALARARDRADVRARKEDLAGQALRLRYEKGSYWPSLDLLGNYYTKRATFMKEVAWDLALSIDVPLFNGGTTAANVRRAQAAQRQSLLALQALERDITHSIRKTYGELASSLEETQAQDEAAAAAQKSYDSLLGEYRLGLVTNLDVLAALDLLQTERNARDAARLRAKVLYYRLGVATETAP